MIESKVSIIGLGYVGLPLVLAIASSCKHSVYGFDIDPGKIMEAKKNGIEASTDVKIIKDSEYVIICVPTPVKSSKKPDMTHIISASGNVAKYLEKNQKIIIESTINPGVCEEIIIPILEKSGLKAGGDFILAHCPERINPGDPEWNVTNIPRNVGAVTIDGCRVVADFYRGFIDAPITEMSCLKAAEATKVIENTFRDINIAYVNELAKSFDCLQIDLVEVIDAAKNKPFSFVKEKFLYSQKKTFCKHKGCEATLVRHLSLGKISEKKSCIQKRN